MSSGQNTRYHVELTANATLDLEEIFGSINVSTSEHAARWFNELENLISSLDHLPERGSITPENPRMRQVLRGNKPHIYRVIYSIQKVTNTVRVLHIRHGARQPMKPGDLM